MTDRTRAAWHFTGTTLRDGRPIPAVGELLRHDGEVVPCRAGLHASVRLIDALGYAPRYTVRLHRVELSGVIIPHDGDKHVATARTILWSIDATGVLRDFARRCALDVIHLWDAPPVVGEYLKTGREDIREAAEDAARAAGAAAGAARDAAVGAVRAAREAAVGTAWDVAVGAARAAWAVQHGAAGAAWDAAVGAAISADHAVQHAVQHAARTKQNRRLTAMVMAEARRQGVVG